MLLAPPVFDLPHYIPSRRWRGGHRMTVYAWAKQRRLPQLPEPEACYFDTECVS